MDEREERHGSGAVRVAPLVAELRDGNEQLLVANLRVQELALDVRDVNEQLLIAGLREQALAAALEVERARLAVILAGIGDAVLVVDEAGRQVDANAAYARLVSGADAALAPQDAQGRPLPLDETPQARAARGETFSLEFTRPPVGEGPRRWYEANGQPLPAHGPAHAVVVIRDITLSSQHRRLQDEFLVLASHELRTPLTSVTGYLDLTLKLARARAGGGDDRLVYYATRAQEQVRRLTALVNDLTDVARLESGKLTLDLVPLDLVPLVARVIATARDLPPGHTIHLDAPTEPVRVRGDAGRVEQVLVNLLTNAFAYAPADAPIEVRLRRVGAEVALEVQDDGARIAAAQLPHLFTRFYQVARDERPSQGGLGLGLFICQEVVAAHGGRIAVASAEGEGTTFTVWLPLRDTAGGVRRPSDDQVG